MMDSEWAYLRKNDSCWNNACVHKYPLRMDPRDFAQERMNANVLFQKRILPEKLKCKMYSDYRLTETPLQTVGMSFGCNKSCDSSK
jgi:hypothetical protein